MFNGRLQQVVAGALHLPTRAIRPDASSDTLEAWDSLGHLEVVLAVEQEFGVKFATEEISELTSFKKISTELIERGVL